MHYHTSELVPTGGLERSSERTATFLDYAWRWNAYVLLFLMCAFPMVLALLYVKAVAFALLLVLTAACVVASRSLPLAKPVITWSAGLAMLNLLGVLIGFYREAPGALKQMQMYVGWSIAWTVFVAGASNSRALAGIRRTFVFSAAFIGVYGLAYLMSETGDIPRYAVIDWLSDEEVQAIGVFDTYTKVRYQGLNSLPFLLPFCLALLSCQNLRTRQSWLRFLGLSVQVSICVFIVMSSGRRALVVNAAFSFLLVPILIRFLPRAERIQKRPALGLTCALSFISVILFLHWWRVTFNFDWQGFVDMVLGGFDFSVFGPESPYERREQFIALMRGWSQYPLFGAGHGASLNELVRSDTLPWAYELSYVALLYQIGLVGFLPHVAGVLWVLWQSVRLIQHGGESAELAIAFVNGLVGMLIANATNPYLARFDGCWALFVPIALVNFWLVRKDRRKCFGRPRSLSAASVPERLEVWRA